MDESYGKAIQRSASGLAGRSSYFGKCIEQAWLIPKLPCSYLDTCNESSNGFAFDQAAGLLCLPTENYCIQFYSLLDNHEIAEVQVRERNHQPGDAITIMVTSVTISPDGSVMCTDETRLTEDGLVGLNSLKFWSCESQKKDFKLSTIVYEPHRDADISAIAFHPASHMVASASHGGDFKCFIGLLNYQTKPKVTQCSEKDPRIN